jgi:hypothetical protein
LKEKIQLGKSISQGLEEYVQTHPDDDMTSVIQQDMLPFLTENIMDVYRVFCVCMQQIVLCETIIRTNRMLLSNARTVSATTRNILDIYLGLEATNARQKTHDLSHQNLQNSLLEVQKNIKDTITTISDNMNDLRE